MTHWLGRLIALAFFMAAIGALSAADEGPGGKKGNSLIDPPEVALRKFTVAPGLKVDLFAAEPDVRNPVAISVDERGRVFVVESDRRRSSVFDIRGHKDWLETDLSFRTVQERADFLRQQLSPTNPAVIKRLVGSGGNGNFGDFNKDGVIDWRDLEVQTERIRLLEDNDGDGRADRASVFADGFTNILAGVAAGVLAQRDATYFACIPDLWKLTAGARTNLLSGFGVHIAFGGHDMHGLIFGPDGKLYWSIADRGTDTNLFAKIKNPIPGLTPELLADSGCIFRANPDGSDFEVIAWGLRNPQELAFDEYGNLFTADNNGDGGDKARWHYVVEGADFGWRIGWQWLEARAYQPKMGPWNGERLWHLAESNTAAWLLPPLAHIGHGPAGLAYNPGTGLPPQFDRHFFLCDFPGHVLMWTNIPDGASFKVGPVKNFFGDLGPTDVAFHPDGGVLVSDWFKSFDKSDKGRIYRIHDPATDASKAVQETKVVLAEGVAKRSVKELADLIGHVDMRVRLEAQWELVRRVERGIKDANIAQPTQLPESANQAFYGLLIPFVEKTNLLAQIHAMWGLGALHQKLHVISPREWNLRSLIMSIASASRPPTMDDWSEELNRELIRLRGDAPVTDVEQLVMLFNGVKTNFAAATRLVAAVGLGRQYARGIGQGFQPNMAHGSLIALLKDNADRDSYLRHAAVVALARIGDTNALLTAAFGALVASPVRSDTTSRRVGLETGVSRPVRLGVLLALRRLGSPEVARFLSDSDPQIVIEAARAINDVPIPDAFPQLASLLGSSRRESAPTATELEFFTLRRALNANFRLGLATNALALASFAARDNSPEPLRIEALELLSQWPKPPGRDQIMGLWRPLPPRDGQPAVEALRPFVAPLLTNAPMDVRLAAMKAVAALSMREVDLFTLVADRKQSTDVRIEALKFLARLNDRRYAGALNLALKDESESLRIAASKLPGTRFDVGSFAKTLESDSMAERQSALASLALTTGQEADQFVTKQVDALLDGSLPKELQLDVLEAAGKRPSLKAKLAAFESRSPKDNPLNPYRPTLYGGNAENGKTLFVENQQFACFRCHKINGEGGDVGPDLTGLGEKKGRDYLLEAIVQPNKEIAAGFESVLIDMKDGTSYAGLVKSETDTDLVLNSPEDGVMTLKKADIRTRQRGLSAMPEDLVTFMSKRELRDIIEFLATTK